MSDKDLDTAVRLLESKIKLCEELQATVVYQLFAQGSSLNNTLFSMRSKTVYTFKSMAEQAIPDFIQRCLDPSYLNAADPDEHLTVTITELNLDQRNM